MSFSLRRDGEGGGDEKGGGGGGRGSVSVSGDNKKEKDWLGGCSGLPLQ